MRLQGCEKAMGGALLSVKCCMQFWTSPSKEEDHERKEKKSIWQCVNFWLSTFVILFHATRHVFGHENTQRWIYIVAKAYKFTIFEICELFVLSYITCLHYPCIQSMIQDIWYGFRCALFKSFAAYDNFMPCFAWHDTASTLAICFVYHWPAHKDIDMPGSQEVLQSLWKYR